ncbi:MAG: DNA ligase D [Gemmatimonadetes bacterium]|nr:MAG: DNA ligase D [Gemmatimonadetes bacterium 13_1_40CM_3_66_12]PYP95953.1 MAG: DNA ligase D [Gemmatimonadota bacterium]
MPRSKSTSPDSLAQYRAKRAFDETPEPGGLVPKPGPKPGGLFIVHMHDATRLHWDLRLEMDGVLRSWAVPKGPSANPTDKRLAVKVEDHPMEYGDFEGIIPEGNYGAGTVIVWDRGVWVPLEDVREGFEKRKLLFELRGYKLRGRWTLIKLKKTEKEWLLIKERDEYVSTEPYSNESVLSGLTNDELRNATQRAEPIKQELEKLGAPKRALRVADTELMLAETREEPFSKDGWIFEVKLDGYRMRAACQDGEPILYSRKGLEYTESFPEIARAVKAIPFEGVILDGELVVLNEAGRPNFNMLQARARLGAREARRAAIESPATLYVFDLLAFGGYDLRKLPLVKRKEILRKILPQTGPLRYSEHFEKNGEALYEQVVKLGLEGIMAKKADSPYRSGRSSDWLKIRADRIDDFVVVGFTKPKGARGGFGSLHVGAYQDRKLIYCGRAGSGFTGDQLEEISAQLTSLVRKTPPCEPPEHGALPKGPDHLWVEPKLVCDVRYKEITKDGLLRQSVFVRFRDDKKPEDVMMPGTGDEGRGTSEPEAGSPRPPSPVPSPREVKLSNLDKVFWPEEGYTKGDLIEYYRSMAPWLLPYLKDRPVVLTRYPDGINGKSFYQKDAPGFVPDWIQTIPIWSEDTQRDIQYFVANVVETLVYLVNLGTIPLHIWMSRIDDLTRPDWCLIDLDPKDAPFEHVITLAKTMRKVCEQVGMPAFIKTTGKSGLHIMLPLGRQMTYQQCLQFAMLFARLVTDRHPDIATTQRTISKREGKVYVDAFQNRAGQLMVAAYSVRPSPGAPVSMPIEWDEVNAKLRNSNFTIANARKRMEKLGHDPVIKVLELKPTLMGVLERLNELIGED